MTSFEREPISGSTSDPRTATARSVAPARRPGRRRRAAVTLLSLVLVSGAFLAAQQPAASAQDEPWMDTSLSPDRRARLLAAEMTVEQKVRLFNPNGQVTVPELGIPPRHEIDATNGVHSSTQPATAMPAAIALAASGSKALARQWGRQTSREVFQFGFNGNAAPTLDLVRSPYWGRMWETFGEDPILSGHLGAAEIRGIQAGDGVYALVKHFGVYTQETSRNTLDNRLTERTLRELYLRNWHIAVKRGAPGAVMCAFPQINGEFACENSHLLNDILKDDWNFEGWVSTDFNAGKTWEQFVNGTDTSGEQFCCEAMLQRVQDGTIPMDRFNDMVHRVLRTMFAHGLFERRAPGTTGTEIEPPRPLPAAVTERGEAVAERAAREGSVLLKNRRRALPLRADVDTLAVIGAGADEYVTGTGSPQVPQAARLTTILEGLRARAGRAGAEVTYASGTDDVRLGDVLPGPAPVPSSVLSPTGGSGPGLTGQYFANPDLSGDPLVTRVDDQVNIRTSLAALIETFDVHTRPEPTTLPFPLLVQPSSMRWTGTLTPAVTGRYTLALTHLGRASLFVDGEEVISDPGTELGTRTVRLDLTAGTSHDIRIDYAANAPGQCCVTQLREGPTVRFGWVPPTDTASPQIRQAVAAARAADAAVVVVRDDVGEATDRYTLSLPQDQDRLIRAVARANKRTVVISATSGPVLMPWLKQVESVVQSWYPGEAGGRALAALLYGDANFTGRLPVTFPRAERQVERVSPDADPTEDFNSQDPTMRYPEGVNIGYRGYLAKRLRPLFAFGHGLSYSRVRYQALRAPDLALRSRKAPSVRVRLRNNSNRSVLEPVHVYIGRLPGRAAAPPKQLAGFRQVLVRPGRTATVRVKLDKRVLRRWDAGKDGWVTATGTVRVHAGGTATDPAVSGSLRITRGR